MSRLEGKVAIITGATRGLGLGIARAFVKEGAKVATIGMNSSRLEAFEKEFSEGGYDVISVQGDISKRENVKILINEAVKKWGTVDILVNNAAAYNYKLLEDTTDEDMAKILGSAVYGSLYCMQEVFPYMKAHGGKIINFGSLAGVNGLIGHASYSIAKEGLLGLTRTAALEWAKYNIQVNAVAPLAATDMWFDFERTQPKEVVADFLKMIPAGHMGDAEKDVGCAIIFLASEDSNWITSRTLFVDGGQAAIR